MSLHPEHGRSLKHTYVSVGAFPTSVSGGGGGVARSQLPEQPTGEDSAPWAAS